MSHASYLCEGFQHSHDIVENALKTLEGVEFEGIVVTGTSGLLIGPILAYVMNKRLAVVRKPTDCANHSDRRVESALRFSDRWIIVDDLVASGDTLRSIFKAIDADNTIDLHSYVGHYVYNSNRFNPEAYDGY